MLTPGTIRRVAVGSVMLGLASCGGGGGSGPPPAISVSFSTPPPSSLAIGSTASIAALVSNDPANGGVNWTVTCAASDCGSFSPTSTGSGVTTTYTAPAQIPSPATVTVTATAVSDSTQTATGTVTITAATGPVLADGTYVYALSGTDGNGPYTITGAFTVASGKITGGEQDFSDPAAGYTDTLVAANSSLNAAGSNIQIVLNTGNTAIGVNGVETLRGTPVSATRVLLSEFDPSAAAVGSLEMQTSAAAPSAGYAFAVSGSDTNGDPIAIGGILDINGTALSVNASVFDFSVFPANANGATVLQKETFQSGSVTAPDNFGRVVFTLTPSGASGVSEFALAGYIVGTNRITLVESAQANDALNANTGGFALGQGTNTGSFSGMSSSVLNQSYAHGSGGVDANGGATMAGAFTLNLNGVLTGTLAVNDIANIGAWTIGGSYAVDPTGRVTLSITSLTSQATPPAKAMTFELYLDGNGNAMVMGADTFQTTQGIAYGQGTSFTLAGNYALQGQGFLAGNGGPFPWGAVGPVTVSSNNFTGSTDYTVLTATMGAVPLAGSANPTQGTLQLSGLNATNFSATTPFLYYPVSNNRLWSIETDNQGLSLLLMEGVTP